MNSGSDNARRAGQYVQQAGDYKAFIPKALPPDPPLRMDEELWTCLSRADRALGRLDGVTETLPNPDLFVFMYVRKEAVLSSQIEGTQASLMDVLEFEAGALEPGRPKDVEEVVNYVAAMNHGLARLSKPQDVACDEEGIDAAMNHGLARLSKLPLSVRLIREIHEKLLANVRGGERSPGELRRSQNWVGPPGSTIETASFIPAPPQEVSAALGYLEKFLHDKAPMPALIKVGLAHAQFETVHPFLDGNGRVGRLLVTFMLCEKGILRRPLLYLSHYFKQHRMEYYSRLQAVRDHGDWEGWLKFFLRGVFEVSEQAVETARRIVGLRESHRREITERFGGTAASALTLLENLFMQPLVSVHHIARVTGLAYGNANKLAGRFEEMGLLREITGRKRNRRFVYAHYLALFEDVTTPPAPDHESPRTS